MKQDKLISLNVCCTVKISECGIDSVDREEDLTSNRSSCLNCLIFGFADNTKVIVEGYVRCGWVHRYIKQENVIRVEIQIH